MRPWSSSPAVRSRSTGPTRPGVHTGGDFGGQEPTRGERRLAVSGYVVPATVIDRVSLGTLCRTAATWTSPIAISRFAKRYGNHEESMLTSTGSTAVAVSAARTAGAKVLG